jgi:hypothetical protein
MTDATLWKFLPIDLLLASAEDRLPPPPPSPAFARETVRPAKEVS